MTDNNENDRISAEFDWFAVDQNGSIGLFSTAGAGFIPQTVRSNFHDHENISDSIDNPHWGTPDIWSDYSEVGLYVYDWQQKKATYVRVRTPTKETENDLRDSILSLSSLVRLKLVFDENRQIGQRLITER